MAEEKKKESEEVQEEPIEFTAKDGFIEEDDIEVIDAEAEMLAETKTADYGRLGTVVLHHPTIEDESAIQMEYSRLFTHLVQTSDLMTASQMERMLEEKGIWTRESEEALADKWDEVIGKGITIAQLKANLKEFLELQVEKKDDESLQKEIDKLSKEIRKIELERMELELEYGTALVEKTRLFESTIEKRAEEKAILLKLVHCIKAEGGEQIWKDVTALEKESSLPHIKRLMTDAIKFWRGAEHPFLEELALKISGSSDTE